MQLDIEINAKTRLEYRAIVTIPDAYAAAGPDGLEGLAAGLGHQIYDQLNGDEFVPDSEYFEEGTHYGGADELGLEPNWTWDGDTLTRIEPENPPAPEIQKFVVCFAWDGRVDAVTLEEYRAMEGYQFSSDPSEPGYYCLMSIEAVTAATAVAIAMVRRLNDEGAIDKLMHAYLEDNDWSLNSADDVSAGMVKTVDRILGQYKGHDKRESPLADCLEVIAPDRYRPDEITVTWHSELKGAIEVVTTNGRCRAYVANVEDIPDGWVRADEYRSDAPGQMDLEL